MISPRRPPCYSAIAGEARRAIRIHGDRGRDAITFCPSTVARGSAAFCHRSMILSKLFVVGNFLRSRGGEDRCVEGRPDSTSSAGTVLQGTNRRSAISIAGLYPTNRAATDPSGRSTTTVGYIETDSALANAPPSKTGELRPNSLANADAVYGDSCSSTNLR